MATAAPDKAALIQELYNRIDTLPADKRVIVRELANRYGAATSVKPPAALGQINSMMGKEPEYAVSHAPDRKDDVIPYPVHAAIGNVLNGVEQMASSFSPDAPKGSTAAAASKLFRGSATLAAPSLAGPSVAAAPVATLGGIAGGTIGAEGAKMALRDSDIPQGYKDVAEDVAGIAGGAAAGLTGNKLDALVKAVIDHPQFKTTALSLIPKGKELANAIKIISEAHDSIKPKPTAASQAVDAANAPIAPGKILTPEQANSVFGDILKPEALSEVPAQPSEAPGPTPPEKPLDQNRSKQWSIDRSVQNEGEGLGMSQAETGNRAPIADKLAAALKKAGITADDLSTQKGKEAATNLATTMDNLSRRAKNPEKYIPSGKTLDAAQARLTPPGTVNLAQAAKPASEAPTEPDDYSELLQKSLDALKKKVKK